MAEYLIQESTLTAIADAIRAKNESSEVIDPSDMATLIESISTGGGGIALKGWVQPTTSQGNTLSLGVELPEADNFILIIYSNSHNNYVSNSYNTVILMHYNGAFLRNMYGKYSQSMNNGGSSTVTGTALVESSNEIFTLNHTTGTITSTASTASTTGYNFYTPKTYYHWVYIAV